MSRGMADDASDGWRRYRHALAESPLPAALVDLDAVDLNRERLVAAARGKRLRLATKSLRCPDLIRSLADALGGAGLMTYSAAETAFLAAAGHRDLLLAYPTAHPADAAHLAAAAAGGAEVKVVVDDPAHLAALERAAAERGARLHVVGCATRPGAGRARASTSSSRWTSPTARSACTWACGAARSAAPMRWWIWRRAWRRTRTSASTG
jgi:D-serine deaminase-like pyridoxal phosphate-dependent protein